MARHPHDMAAAFISTAFLSWRCVMGLVATLMLASAPVLATPPAAHAMPAHHMAMPQVDEGCPEAQRHHDMPSARCLASCLAATAATWPPAPCAGPDRIAVRAMPQALAMAALVPSLLPIDPPPPRLA